MKLPSSHMLGSINLIGIGVTSLVHGALSIFVQWVASGVNGLLNQFDHLLVSGTSVTFGSGFVSEFSVLRGFGAVLVGGFLCLVTIEAVIRQDIGYLVRSVVLRMPAALLFSGVAMECVSALLGASDALSNALLATDRGSFDHLARVMITMLHATSFVEPALAGFGALIFEFALAVAIFVCLIELVMRAAAIAIASLFIPLAMAGLVWPATQHWMRRLAEVLFALIMSKVAIVAIFVLAFSSFGSPHGISSIIEGIAIFVLASWAPFSLFRLLPFFEASSFSQLESVMHRGGQVLLHASNVAAPIIGDRLAPPSSPTIDVQDGIAWAEGEPNTRIEADQEDADVFQFVSPWVVFRDQEPREQGNDANPNGRAPTLIDISKTEDE